MRPKKLAATLTLFAMVLFAGIFGTSNINASAAASNSLSATYKLMYVGQNYTPKVKGSYSSVKWSTSNSNIASINSSGKVTGVNIGRANIYATVNGQKLTLKVEVVSESTYNAVRYANKAVGCKYSQSRRMSKGYYDCGSLVWRSYASAGVYIGGKTDWAPTAASSASTLNKSYKTIAFSGVSSSELLPGDLIFTSSSKNGRYRNITHAAMYVGNGKIVEAANSRVGVVKRNYSQSKIVLIARPTVNVSKTLQQPQMTATRAASSEVTNTSVDITWKKVRGASGYYVYRKAAGSDKYTKIATVKGNTKVSYTDKKAYAGKYIYTVRAYSGSKTSPYNSKGMTASTKINKPSDVNASSIENGISVKWKTVKYATGYKVYRKKAGASSYSLVKTVSGQKTSSFKDAKAESGTKYTYIVKAFRKNSSSNTVTSAASAATKKVAYTKPTEAQTTVAASSGETASTAAAAETTVAESSAAETETSAESSAVETVEESSSTAETTVTEPAENKNETPASESASESPAEESSASAESAAAESD